MEFGRANETPDARPIGDQTHMWANFAIQLPRKCHNVPTREITAASEKPHNTQMRLGMEAFCTYAPTLDILDLVLDSFLQQCEHILDEASAVRYLKKEKYVEKIATPQLQKWHIPLRSADKDSYWFSPAWQGLFGCYPGAHCGSQPVEAFHAGWAKALEGLGAEDRLAADLSTMQSLYRNNTSFTSLWPTDAGSIRLDTPRAINPELFHGECLRRTGLSPALDYWVARTSVAHYVEIALNGLTILAMSNKGSGIATPATTPLNQQIAQAGAKMMFIGGIALSLPCLQHAMFDHCVVWRLRSKRC